MIPRVSSKAMQRILKARLMFEAGKFDQLAAINPKVDAERLWQLTALARTNLKGAGTQLDALVQRVTPALPQLRVLAGYYAVINDQKQVDEVARLIVKQVSKQVDRIKVLIEEAIDEGSQARAQHLLKQLDTYHPEEDYDLKLLRTKVNKLHKNSQAKAA